MPPGAMKILLVQDHLRGGGTERQTVFLARAFAARGHGVSLLTFRPGGALTAELAGTAVGHHALQPFDTGLDWFVPGLIRRTRHLAPDLVLCMGRMANCRGAQLQRALPAAAVVATVRTGKPLPWLFRRSLRAVRHIVANSEFARRSLVAPTGAAERCSVIPNALLYSALLDTDAAPADPARVPTLVWVAQFRPEKNQRELIEILATLPRALPWRLELAGDGVARAACERRVAELGLADRISFLGWQADPAALYRRADLAVLTSRRESLPNFLVEAQCAGLPVVSYEVGGAAECFRDGVSGLLIPAGDRTRYAAALAELLAQPERRAAMGAAAREWARAQFDPVRQVDAYLALFAQLLGR